ncbi:NAD-dependent epimerase [Sphaerisporangium rufum]|uniref:NAD-dependent epimerase n=1 Tax=Sphaerisporangium rufum TaxID=1381558 RepID=A0A919R0Q6_9ACTN|nr:NAD-dependent epimerase/dehydratase family protein [Sphaerisporangium rufum]GII76276.1 NAD-dependent epimerase [Sphaerisporangium rufum]
MLVTVTGGTGFVGAHSVAAIAGAGHRVRMLVRDPDRAARALAPLGVDPGAVHTVPGDVRDAGAVRAAVRGADAVLHAASVYSFDSRRHAEMRAVNERGTEVVLGEARRAGAGLIVHVSSIVALYPASPARVLDAGSPVGRPRETYMATKAAAEQIARRHQADGAPVVITYPPALLGPHDPNLGDQTARLRDVLRGLTPMWPAGGFPVGDVRDTAALHARLLDGAAGRYFGPGRHLTTREYVAALRAVTGRRLPAVFLPARAMLPVGWLADRLQRVWPWHIPAEYGAIYTCACAVRVAEHAPTGGLAPRPLAETVGDTVRWLRDSGHLTARQAGAVRPDLASVGAR